MSDQSLKDKTAKGLLWGGLSNGAQQLLNLVFGIFLARLLTADDYGMVGMLSIFSLIAASIQESGFTAALANKKDIRHEDYNAVFWGSFLIGSTLYIILFFCAPLIAAFFHQPELTALARYSFLGFLISSLGIAHNAYMFRNLMTKQKALSNMTALALSGIVAIILAYCGFAYWGIATQSLVYISTNTLLYWHFSGWRPSMRIDLSPIRNIIGFSSKMLFTNIFNHINNNLFSVILGRFYSEREVGYYNQANKWNYMAHILITGMIGGIAQPVLAQTTDEKERQRQIFRKMLRFTSFVSFPALLGLSLIAPEFITIAITDKWLPSAEILQLLSIGGAFIPLTTLYSNLIVSKGKSNIYMWNTIVLGLLQLAIMLLTYPYGIITMVKIYVAVNILWLLVWHFFVWREIQLSIIHALMDILPFAAAATAAILTAHFVSAGIGNIYLSLTAKIAIAASLYILIMWASRSAIFRESVEYFKKTVKKQRK